MARETFTLKHNLNALHDAILAARPDLAAELRVEGKGDEVTITAPDEARDTIAASVAAHDPDAPTQAQADEQRRAEAKEALAGADFAALQTAIGQVRDPAVQAALTALASLLYDLTAERGLAREAKPHAA